MTNVTETARARQHMTPESRALFRDSTLSARLGRGTVAGGLNSQIRFRFDHHGAPSDWSLVPDNERSAQLLASPAGTRLQQGMRHMLASFDAAHGHGLLALQGVMMAEDEQSWAAGYQLMQRDAARRLPTPMSRPMSPAEAMGQAEIGANVAAAQSIWGWVQIAPDVARNMLTSVGAYTPSKIETGARSGRMASTIGETLAHEFEHRVSEAGDRTAADLERYDSVSWLEEGTAMLRTDPARSNASWGVSPQSHAAHVAARDNVSVGWEPWVPDARYLAQFGDTVQSDYIDSVDTLRGLLRLAGVDRRTTVGQDAAFDLLQGPPVVEVPDGLARAILREHDLRVTAHRVADLSALVVDANRNGGLERVSSYVNRLLAER